MPLMEKAEMNLSSTRIPQADVNDAVFQIFKEGFAAVQWVNTFEYNENTTVWFTLGVG